MDGKTHTPASRAVLPGCCSQIQLLLAIPVPLRLAAQKLGVFSRGVDLVVSTLTPLSTGGSIPHTRSDPAWRPANIERMKVRPGQQVFSAGRITHRLSGATARGQPGHYNLVKPVHPHQGVKVPNVTSFIPCSLLPRKHALIVPLFIGFSTCEKLKSVRFSWEIRESVLWFKN